MKRGLNYAEAMAYVGVKRRTFDATWRPRLSTLHQGTSLIFDREELDRVFDELKGAQAGHVAVALPSSVSTHNGTRNERPAPMKGVTTWADEYRGSTPAARAPGQSTSGTPALDFSGVASRILRKQRSG
jgi:hypothetical protein